MNVDLKGKRALVGGGTQGIGWACAYELASLGASVTLLSRTEETLAERVRELPVGRNQRHGFIAADSGDPAALRAGVEVKLSGGEAWEILVHNTGGPPEGRAFDCSPADYEQGFRSHLVSGQVLVQALVPGMKASEYGRIITITSTSAKAPIQGLGVSNVVRAAVANWVKSLSLDLGPMGITVNNVMPGFTETARLDSLIEAWAKKAGITPEQWIKDRKATVPLKRFGRAEEVAAAVAFLASPAASYISGVNLPVDGGRLPTL